MAPDRIAVIHDTDIGSDIDDAVALAYLLRQPRCELVGVTTVSGATDQRAALAEALCRAAGRPDIPVHAGSPGPLLHGPGQREVPQYAALAGAPPREVRPPGAIEFLRAAIRARPGEITLLSTGPFTNVALLFATDPEIPALLKSLVCMAGVFWPHAWGPSEWNCRVDPVATAMALAARPPRTLLVGLDVTARCRMPVAEVRRRFVGPPLDLVAAMTEIWARRNDQLTFHDPLAAAVIFKLDLCTYERGEVAVTVDAGRAGDGVTTLALKPDGPHEVAAGVDPDAFFREYFSVFA